MLHWRPTRRSWYSSVLEPFLQDTDLDMTLVMKSFSWISTVTEAVASPSWMRMAVSLHALGAHALTCLVFSLDLHQDSACFSARAQASEVSKTARLPSW